MSVPQGRSAPVPRGVPAEEFSVSGVGLGVYLGTHIGLDISGGGLVFKLAGLLRGAGGGGNRATEFARFVCRWLPNWSGVGSLLQVCWVMCSPARDK